MKIINPALFAYPKNTFFKVIIFWYYFVRIFGFASFTIDGDFKIGKTRVTVYDFIIYAWWTSISALMFRKSFIADNNQTDSYLFNFGLNLQLYVALGNAIISLTLDILMHSKYWTLFVKLNEVNDKVFIQKILLLNKKEFIRSF